MAFQPQLVKLMIGRTGLTSIMMISSIKKRCHGSVRLPMLEMRRLHILWVPCIILVTVLRKIIRRLRNGINNRLLAGMRQGNMLLG